MIVIASKTEIKLREDLRRCVRLKPNQRCFFLEFSRTDIPKSKLFETFLRLLENIPNSYMAQVYLCQDKDILIMMEGFMQRPFLDFVKKLAETLDEEDFSELVDIFEISKHWSRIEALYTAKIEAIDEQAERRREEQRMEHAEKNMTNIMRELDPVLVNKIDDTRSNRGAPLVMIADDDQLSRTLAGNVLRSDYNMVFAKNGTEAVKEYVASAPDILFLDIGMPDIGGHEVLECLFQIDPDAYIIMFSGRKDRATIMTSLEKGAQGFLGKPFTRDQLFTHVGNSPFVKNKKTKAA